MEALLPPVPYGEKGVILVYEVDSLTDEQVLERYSSPGEVERIIGERMEEVRKNLSLGAQLYDEQESAEALIQITQNFLEGVAEEWKATVTGDAQQHMSIEDMRIVLRFKEEHPGLLEREAEFRANVKALQSLWLAGKFIDLAALTLDFISDQRARREKSST